MLGEFNKRFTKTSKESLGLYEVTPQVPLLKQDDFLSPLLLLEDNLRL